MNLGKGRKFFVCFLSICFFLLTGGFPWLPGQIAQAKETASLSIGEMISRGDVKFEAREKVWKPVDPLHFPVFKGMKVKTEKGVAVFVLGSNTQVELGEQSSLSVDEPDRVTLLDGRVDFRIPAGVEASFSAGTLAITKSKSLQAAKGSAADPRNAETIGSIILHPNGAATVKSYQGNVSIVKQGQVLAALSPKDTMTIPSVTVSADPKTKTDRAGASDLSAARSTTSQRDPNATRGGAGAGSQDLAGLLWLPLAGAAGVAAIGLAGASQDDHDLRPVPRCR